MKKLLFLLLALPMFAAAEQVPYTCGAGNAFTLNIPVKTRGMSVEYVWYRNDTVVQTTPLTAGVTSIAYTIPAGSAYGSAVAYHFKYRLNDGCEEWSRSPQYVITFMSCPAPQASEVAGSTEICENTAGLIYSVERVEGVFYEWAVPEGWTIAYGQGTSSITTIAANTAASTPASSGSISVTPRNGCGSGSTKALEVAVSAVPVLAIEGLATVCANVLHVTYSVSEQQGVAYEWSVPAAWTVTAGRYSHSVTVRTSAASGMVSVAATSSCGSAADTKAVSSVANCLPSTCAGVSSPGAVDIAPCVPGPSIVSIFKVE